MVFVKIQIRLHKEFDIIVSQYAKVFRVTNVLVGRKMVLSMSKIGNYVTLVRPKHTWTCVLYKDNRKVWKLKTYLLKISRRVKINKILCFCISHFYVKNWYYLVPVPAASASKFFINLKNVFKHIEMHGLEWIEIWKGFMQDLKYMKYKQ